jgi:pimeloyl-ACP methyl ester carboxylesterase
MSTFALIHGGGDGGWAWHLVEAELRARGHDTVAPDLPYDDDSKDLNGYADFMVEAVGDRKDVIVVGHSFGGFTAPLTAARLKAELVFVAGMIPAPGESPDAWWANTGFGDATKAAAEQDGGLTGNEDPYVGFYHDVPRELADEALRRERGVSNTPMSQPWPLEALPDVPTRFVLCTEDRFFPPDFFRRLVAERLGIEPVEIKAGHCVGLSRPAELADILTK